MAGLQKLTKAVTKTLLVKASLPYLRFLRESAARTSLRRK
jgi:hypothetical protein